MPDEVDAGDVVLQGGRGMQSSLLRRRIHLVRVDEAGLLPARRRQHVVHVNAVVSQDNGYLTAQHEQEVRTIGWNELLGEEAPCVLCVP
jgi:hypothetical protein